MGTWGPGLLQDDVAFDTMINIEEALTSGLSIQAATARVLEAPDWDLADLDDASVIYLALAALQLQHGVLEPHIRDLALGTITSGAAMARWEDEPEERAAPRREVLQRTEAILRRGTCTPEELWKIVEPAEYRRGPWTLR